MVEGGLLLLEPAEVLVSLGLSLAPRRGLLLVAHALQELGVAPQLSCSALSGRV